MNKNILMKFFRGIASEKEIDQITVWIDKNPKNKQYFASQKAVWTLSSYRPEVGDKTDLQEILSKIKEKNTQKWRWVYLSTAAILILCFTLDISLGTLHKIIGTGETTQLTDNTIPTPVAQSPAPQKKYTLYTAKGTKATIELPDGTKVWLNSDSKIEYPKEFEGNTREVVLEGEAYFEVVKNPGKPMVIKTGKDFSVEVLGTKLSVKSYSNDSSAVATLYSGVVKLHYLKKEGDKKVDRVLDMKPNETCVLQNGAPVAQMLSEKKINEIKAWREGELIFDETPMDEVIRMLERWHGTKFIVENSAIHKYTLSASFESESIVQIMEMVKLCIPIHYSVNKNTVKIW